MLLLLIVWIKFFSINNIGLFLLKPIWQIWGRLGEQIQTTANNVKSTTFCLLKVISIYFLFMHLSTKDYTCKCRLETKMIWNYVNYGPIISCCPPVLNMFCLRIDIRKKLTMFSFRYSNRCLKPLRSWKKEKLYLLKGKKKRKHFH